MKLSRVEASALLSKYLSSLFREDIRVPAALPDAPTNGNVKHSVDHTITDFFGRLPHVVQMAVDGETMCFRLPLVASSKGTNLSKAVAFSVNELLADAADNGSSDNIEVPTFFYADGSAMVIVINPVTLGLAITDIQENPSIVNFIKAAMSEARHGGQP